jgi:hypothetical protein
LLKTCQNELTLICTIQFLTYLPSLLRFKKPQKHSGNDITKYRCKSR